MPSQKMSLSEQWQWVKPVWRVLVAVCVVLVPNFGHWDNIKNLLLSVSLVGVVCCTMLFCLAGGDFEPARVDSPMSVASSAESIPDRMLVKTLFTASANGLSVVTQVISVSGPKNASFR